MIDSAGAGAVRRRAVLLGLSALPLAAASESASAQSSTDPLPSWNDGPARQAVLDFVRATTDPANRREFLAPEDRIAAFDQDGTLWVEHPLYAQAMFALHRVRALAPRHRAWRTEEPFRSVLFGSPDALAKFTEKDWMLIIAATHAGMTTTAFLALVRNWLETARHPRFKRPYTDLVYQPMIEVMAHLRANGFRTYIVTAGGVEFVRAYSQRVYGIPPEQVIGSSVVTQYKMPEDGQPVLMRLPKPFFVDSGPGKPVGINMFIGKRPYAAFGNSSGDADMLTWTQAGAGKRLEMLVHHDDAVREYAYGPAGGLPGTKVGTFPQALMEQAKTRGWTVTSMKTDWRRIFAFE